MLNGSGRMPLLPLLYVLFHDLMRLQLTIRLGRLCPQNQKRERRSYTSYWIYIVSFHLGKRLSVELNVISQAASGCKFPFRASQADR
jgi:hypothetical protein